MGILCQGYDRTPITSCLWRGEQVRAMIVLAMHRAMFEMKMKSPPYMG